MAANRRLAAVMFTDMVGYTAAIQADETGTLMLLQEQGGRGSSLVAHGYPVGN